MLYWVRVFAVVVFLAAPLRALGSPLALGRFEYRLAWNGIPAASASIDVRRDGASTTALYHVAAEARTAVLVDLLWSLRAEATSSFTADRLIPLGFRYDREINHERSVTDVIFDPAAAQVTGRRWRHGEIDFLDPHDPGLLDPITAIFRALDEPVRAGDTSQYEVFTGEARYRVSLTVLGEDEVSVRAGSFPAWRVEPRVWKVGSGLDRRLQDATIWVTRATPRTLLRIQSAVFIGTVTCDLQRFELSAPEHAA